MPGLLLRRPLASRLPHQHVVRNPAQHLIQPRRSSPQPHTQVGKLLYRKRKLKLPLKPRWHLAHRFTQTSPIVILRQRRIFASFILIAKIPERLGNCPRTRAIPSWIKHFSAISATSAVNAFAFAVKLPNYPITKLPILPDSRCPPRFSDMTAGYLGQPQPESYPFSHSSQPPLAQPTGPPSHGTSKYQEALWQAQAQPRHKQANASSRKASRWRCQKWLPPLAPVWEPSGSTGLQPSP